MDRGRILVMIVGGALISRCFRASTASGGSAGIAAAMG
jgi:hypothetical protein